jgi:hypothetical protein
MSKTLSSILKGGTLPVIHGGTGVTISTGTGAVVLSTSPALITPELGIATATTINKVAFTTPTSNATLTLTGGKTLSVTNTLTFSGTDSATVSFRTGGTAAYTEEKLSTFSATTSAELASVLTDETGTGKVVFSNNPVLISPLLGDASASSMSITNSGSVKFFESTINGVNFVGIKSPANLAADYTLTLPNTTGLPGQVISTDGIGNLQFTDADAFAGNRVYVSANKGSDTNDGITGPVRTIKRALQIASGMVYNSVKAPTGVRVNVNVAAGEYVEDNPIIIPDNVSVAGDGLRACIIRPLNANKDLFRIRNGGYFTQFTFRDGISANGVATYTWDYAIAFDDVFDTSTSRDGYINLPSTKPTMTLSPYIQNCTAISFLGGNGAYVDGGKIANPNVPANLLEVEVNPAGAAPVQGKSMIANAFTMILFGGTAWRVVNDAYVQLVSCFQLFALNGIYTQSGGYASVTNSATNFGIYALRSSGYSPVSFSFDRGFISEVGFSGTDNTITAIGFRRPDGPVQQYVIRVYSSAASFTYNVEICQRDIGFVIDALRYDMMFGSNFRSIKAGMSYYTSQAATVVGVQKDATIAAFTFLRDYVANAVNGDPLAGISVVNNMNIINNIISNGLSAVPTIVMPEPPTIEAGYSNAARLLYANKSFLQSEIAAFVDTNYHTLWISLSPAQQAQCTRDMGYVVDAIRYDLTYGGNLETSVAARLYKNQLTGVLVEPPGEQAAVTAVYERLKSIIGYILTNNTSWTLSSGNSATQYVSGDNASTEAIAFTVSRFEELRVMVSTGVEPVTIEPAVGWVVDTNLVIQSTILQTNKDAIKTFVTDYITTQYGPTDLTSTYKIQSPNYLNVTFNAATAVNITTNTFTKTAHGLNSGDSVIYNTNGLNPLGGMITGSAYYVVYKSVDTFQLAHDNSLSLILNITSVSTGIQSIVRNDYELFVNEILETHHTFQTIVLTGNTYNFIPGQKIEATTAGQPNSASIYSFNGSNTIVVAINKVTIATVAIRKLLDAGSVITKAGTDVISVTVLSATLRSDLHGATFTVSPTLLGGSVDNTDTLPGKQIYFHRASIVNSSGHTWEFAGSGIDYNALPVNGGQGNPEFQQFEEHSGRVYSSGTNELGDFEVGNFITAYNRTGNIVFKNTVTVSQLNVLKLALSDISIDAISNDYGLGENEVGGPSDNKLSTQRAIWSYFKARLGAFIDKSVSTNAVPGSVVQLNSAGQINSDLIPAQRSSAAITTLGYYSRLVAYDDVPSVNFLSGDTSTEKFQTVTLTLNAAITALDGVLITQSSSGATGYLKGDHTNVSVILVASIYDTFSISFDTNSGHTLTINGDSTPSVANGAVYCTVVSSAVSASDTNVLRDSSTNQYLVVPYTGSYTYTIANINGVFRYNNNAYVITSSAHNLVTNNQVSVIANTLVTYTSVSYITRLSATAFTYANSGSTSTASASTTATATIAAASNTTTTTGSISAAGLTGTITTNSYVFGGGLPIGSIITTVNMGVDPRTFTITFPSTSSVSSTSTASLTFFTPTVETGTVRSVITAVNSQAQGEITELRLGMLTVVNNLSFTRGSSYTNGTYNRVALTNVTGSGTGAIANITVAGNIVASVDLIYAGSGYAIGNSLSASIPGGTGFAIPITGIESRIYINNITGGQFTGTASAPDFITDNTSTSITITVSATTTKTFNASSNVNYGTNRITITAHGLTNGDSVMYNPGINASIGNLSSVVPYYIKRIDADTIELYSEYNLTTIVVLGTSSSGTHSLVISAINITNNRLYSVSHGLSTGNAVTMTGSNLPSFLSGGTTTQISDRQTFFIGSVTTNSFTLHFLRSDALTSISGASNNEIDFSTLGSSTLSLIHNQVQIIGYSNTSSKNISNWGLLTSSSIDASNIVSGTIATSRLGSSGIASSTTYLRGDSSWATAVASIQSNSTVLTLNGSGVSPYYGSVTIDIAKATFPTDAGDYSTLGVAKFNVSQFDVGTGASAGQVFIKAGVIDAGTLDTYNSSYFLNPANFTASIPVNKGGTGLTVYTIGDMIYASTTTTISTLGIGPANTILTSNGSIPTWSTSLTLATTVNTNAGEILTTSTGTANVFNTSALSLNIGGVASSVAIGVSSATRSFTGNVKNYTTSGSAITSVAAVIGATLIINTIARNGSNVATISTTSAHGLTNGDMITIVCTNTTFSVLNVTVASVVNTTTFTYSNTGSILSTISGVGNVYTGGTGFSLFDSAVSSSTQLRFSGTTGIVIGQLVQATAGIPINTIVTGVDSTSVYLSNPITVDIASLTTIIFTHTNTSLGIRVGDQITIASSGITNLNGTWPVTSVGVSSSSFTFKISTIVTLTSVPRAGTIEKINSLVLRNRTVTLGSSEASTTPIAAILKGENAVGTNVSASNFTITPGLATGTGTTGNFIVKTGAPEVAGDITQLATTRLTIDGNGLATFENSVVVKTDLESRGVEVTSITSATAILIKSFSSTVYRSAKFIFQVTCTASTGSNLNTYQVAEVLVIHNGTNAYMVEYGDISTTASGGMLATFTCDVNSGNVRMFAQAAYATDTISVRVISSLTII